jgi:DNA-binding SARP family transcriptional activator
MNPLPALFQRLEALRTRGVVLGVWGQAGIGKTHTVQNLLANLPHRFLSVHATAPLGQLCQQLPMPKNLPTWAAHARHQLQNNAELEPNHTLQTIAEVLRLSAPFVLHIEDIHELDNPEFVVQLAQVVQKTTGVALLVTSRQPPPAPFEALRLEPLPPSEQQALLHQQAGADLPKAALEWIETRAVGNPLFALEFFRFLSRQGYLWFDSRTWHWRTPEATPMPASIEALIEQTLSAATSSQAVLWTLRARAFLSQVPETSLWAAVAGLTAPELEAAKTRLEQHGILRGVHFSHPLFAEVGLVQTPNTVRQTLAQRAIKALQYSNPVAASAFLSAANLPANEQTDLLLAAANHAAQLGQFVQEATLLAQVVPRLHGAEREDLAFKAAQKLRHINVPHALEMAHLALSSPNHQTQAVLLMAELLAIQGHGAQAESMLSHLPQHERQGALWQARLIWIRALGYNELGALEVLQQHPEALEVANPEIQYRAARVLAQHGLLEQAQAVVQSGLAVPNLTLEGQVWMHKADSIIAYHRADFVRMEQIEHRIYRLTKTMSNLRLMDAALYNRSLALDVLGRQAERLKCLDAALQTCLELRDQTAYVIAQIMYADCLHQTAQYEHAETMLHQALNQLERVDLTVHRFEAERALAALYQDWQPPQGKLLAQKYAKLALEHAKTLGADSNIALGYAGYATALAWAGKATEALPLAQQAVNTALGLAMPVNRAVAFAALGYVQWQLGQNKAALEAYRSAESTAQSYGHAALTQHLGMMQEAIGGDQAALQHRLRWFEAHTLENNASLTKRFLMLTDPASAPSLARLEVLGTMQISTPKGVAKLRGQKRFELLALLLEAQIAGRQDVARLEILDTLYPNEPEDRANSSLKNLISNIRQTIHPQAINTTSNGYALGNLTSDAEEFLQTHNTHLWRGAYLEGLLLVHGFESVRDGLCAALFAAAENLLETNPKEAARVGRILLEMDGYNLHHLALTLRAFKHSNNHKTLKRVYAQARATLLEVAEELPEHWADFLAQTNQMVV